MSGKPGRRWGPLRGEDEAARNLAAMLRSVLDEKRLTLRYLADRMPYYERTSISQNLNGETRPERRFIDGFITAICGDDRAGRERLERKILPVWEAADPVRAGRSSAATGRSIPPDLQTLLAMLRDGGGIQPLAALPEPVNIPAAPEFLMGRDELLADLRSRLTSGRIPGPRIAVLYGMGGVGKTSVALAYVHRYSPSGVIWQIDAEKESTIQDDFAALADYLKGTGWAVNTQNPVASVHAILRKASEPWLLLFDNAPDPASVHRFLPPAGTGQVLITSQNYHWPAGWGVEVPVLAPDVAARFLQLRADDPDENSAHGLGQQLDGLPLALEQAGAYAAATSGTLSQYLQMFRSRRAELLDSNAPAGYNKTVWTTWSLAFDWLAENAEIAAELLRLLSCMAPAPIPLSLLLAVPEATLQPKVARSLTSLCGDALRQGQAVQELRRFSLITPTGSEQVQVHRLVQAVTLDRMPPDIAAGWRETAAVLTEAAIPANVLDHEHWPECSQLLPHARALLQYDSPGLGRVVLYLLASGNFASTNELVQRLAEAYEHARGTEDRTSQEYRFLAEFLPILLNGDTAGTLKQLQEIDAHAQKLYGPDNPLRPYLSLINSRDDPVFVRDMSLQEARELEAQLGPGNPLVLDAKIRAAGVSGHIDGAAAARDRLAELITELEAAVTLEHPTMQIAYSMLATWTAIAGDPATARDLSARLWAAQAETLGPEHPDTILTRSNLAEFTGMTGDIAGAQRMFRALMPVAKRVFGPHHPETVRIRIRYGNWNIKVTSQALKLAWRLLRTRRSRD